MTTHEPLRRRFRWRFRMRAVLVAFTLVAVVCGGWIGASVQRLRRIESLQAAGYEIVISSEPPILLSAIGVQQVGPLFKKATMRIRFDPTDKGAAVNGVDMAMPDAEQAVIEMATRARAAGVDFVGVWSRDALWDIDAASDPAALRWESLVYERVIDSVTWSAD